MTEYGLAFPADRDLRQLYSQDLNLGSFKTRGAAARERRRRIAATRARAREFRTYIRRTL